MKMLLMIYSIQEARFFLRGIPARGGRFEADESLTSSFSGDAMRAPLTTIGRRRATILVMSGAVFPGECAVYHSVADTIIQWRNPGEDYSRLDEERRICALRTRRIMSLLARTSAQC